MKRFCCGVIVAIWFCGGGVANAQSLPSYMAPIAGPTSATPADIATKDVLALNTGMFELYGDAAKIFQKNFLGNHPVILGLFSGAGGRLILYRPGMPPMEAPQVPMVYQLMKSVGHSTMALAEVVGPYLNNPDNKSWRGSMLAYRSRMQSALDGIDATAMQPDWRPNNRTILQNNTPGHAGVADAYHRRPLGGFTVLRQLSSDGFRANGWRRPRRNYRRNRQAWHDTVPAAGRAVWFKAVADTGHTRSRSSISRRLINTPVTALTKR